jgi:hypothetical protein
MSGQLDVVELAMGDVSIPVSDLTLNDRVEVFAKIIEALKSFYNRENKGGGSFLEWEKESYGEKWTTHTLRRQVLVVDRSLWPKSDEYDHTTRIVSLTCESYRENFKEKPKEPNWKVGDIKLVYRLCVTNEGAVFLERYEGMVAGVDEKYSGVPTTVVVSKASFHRLRYYRIEDDSEDGVAWREIKLLLKHDPFTLFSFGSSVLRLFNDEAVARERRAERERIAFNKLNAKLSHFGITHP